LDEFLGDRKMLEKVEEYLQNPTLSDDQRKTLNIFQRTFRCYIIDDPEALSLREQIGEMEATLATQRNLMPLGYTDSSGKSISASSVQLRNIMRTSDHVNIRRSCYEGMRSIGDFVTSPFCE